MAHALELSVGGRVVRVTSPGKPYFPKRSHWGDGARAQASLAAELVRRLPRPATTERRKRERGARVYLDHGQFLVAAAHSVRAVPRALVSAPVGWEELDSAEPEDFDVTTMPARFARLGDLTDGARLGSIEALLR